MCTELSDGQPEWPKSRASDKAGSAPPMDKQQNSGARAGPITAPFPRREGMSLRGQGACAPAGWPHPCTESSRVEMAVPRAWECHKQAPMWEDVQRLLVLQAGFPDHAFPGSTISGRVLVQLGTFGKLAGL